jgi:hypothetical protein
LSFFCFVERLFLLVQLYEAEEKIFEANERATHAEHDALEADEDAHRFETQVFVVPSSFPFFVLYFICLEM